MSEPQRFLRVAELFEAARSRSSADRDAFLQDACGDDPEVLADVRRLLMHHDEDDSLLDAPVLSATARSEIHRVAVTPERPPHIGQYRIKRELGIGGMGIVYLAEQAKPRREVAIKVIRPGLASRELLKRFDLEAAMLGRLQHPGIAQIYEAGTYDDGSGARPYFAMEYVDGAPLVRYVRDQALDVRARLEMLARVCDAVHHAHQRGIIHRDLKPGNIVVDPSGQPKVLDFGIARAIDSDLQASTVHTDVGRLMGTVAYMSPEQVNGLASDVDTRSDVYALGVILYELLADRPPYDLSDRTLVTAATVIAEQEPAALTSVNRRCRGDLNTIAMKTLEKDPERRYQSASDLAAEISRYLNDEPIQARPATTTYQLIKLARRNKGLAASVAASFVLLVAGTTVATILAINANRSAQAESRAHAEATKRAEELGQVTAFQAAQLSQLDIPAMGAHLKELQLDQYRSAMGTRGLDEPAVAEAVADLSAGLLEVNFTDVALRSLQTHVFDTALLAVESQFHEQPLIKAELLQTLATTLRVLGLDDAAEEPQTAALAIRRDRLGDENPATLESINAMGLLLKTQGQLDAAEPLYREALATRRRVLGDDHVETVTSLINMGLLLQARDELVAADACFREAVETSRRAFGIAHRTTLYALNNLGVALESQDKLEEAYGYYLEALEGRRQLLGDEHRDTLNSINNMGVVLGRLGRLDEAMPYLSEALEGRRRVLGNEHPKTLVSVSNMGGLLRRLGKLDEAEPYFREALDTRRRTLGGAHPSTLRSLHSIAAFFVIRNELDRAEQHYREALEGRRRVLGVDHKLTLLSQMGLASVLVRTGAMAEAETLLLEAYDLSSTRGASASMTVTICEHLVALYEVWHETEPDL